MAPSCFLNLTPLASSAATSAAGSAAARSSHGAAVDKTARPPIARKFLRLGRICLVIPADSWYVARRNQEQDRKAEPGKLRLANRECRHERRLRQP